MAIQKSMLLSALFAVASVIKAAPLTTSCHIELGLRGPLVSGNATVGLPTNDKLGPKTELIFGGTEQNFLLGVCQEHREDLKGLTTDYRGYLASVNDSSQCLTISQLERIFATYSFQPCKFIGTDNVDPTQTFAWIRTAGQYYFPSIYFVGEGQQFVNSTSGTKYSLQEQDGDNSRLVSYYNYHQPTQGGGVGLTFDMLPIRD